MEIIKNCSNCSKEFKAKLTEIKRGGGKYCSRKCLYISMKGRKPKNFDKHMTPFKKGHSVSNTGRTWFQKTGRKFIGSIKDYKLLHDRINRKLGKPNHCVKCASTYYVEWANKSREYKEKLDDWIALCRKCHFHYDGGRGRIYA